MKKQSNKIIKHEFALNNSKLYWTEIENVCIISRKDLMRLLKEIKKLNEWIDEYKKYS